MSEDKQAGYIILHGRVHTNTYWQQHWLQNLNKTKQLEPSTHKSNNTYARFYQLGINLGIANPRSEDNPRFILGLSFSVLSTFSNLGITNLGITRLSL